MYIRLLFVIISILYQQFLFCSSRSSSLAAATQPSLQETQKLMRDAEKSWHKEVGLQCQLSAIQKRNEHLYKKNIAEQCVIELQKRQIHKQASADQRNLSIVQDPHSQIVRHNPDQIVYSWITNQLALSAVQAMLAFNIYNAQKKLSYARAIDADNISQVSVRYKFLANIPEQDRNFAMHCPMPPCLQPHFSDKELHGLEMYIHQQKYALQENMYQDHKAFFAHYEQSLQTNIYQSQMSLQANQQQQNSLQGFFNIILKNMTGVYRNIDPARQNSRLQNIAQQRAAAYHQLDQLNQVAEQELMMAEDKPMHDVIQKIAEQKKLAAQEYSRQSQETALMGREDQAMHQMRQVEINQRKKQQEALRKKEAKNEYQELQAMARAEKEQRKFLKEEKELLIRQKRKKEIEAAKLKNLLFFQERQERERKELERLQEEKRKKAEQQRLQAEEKKQFEESQAIAMLQKERNVLDLLDAKIKENELVKEWQQQDLEFLKKIDNAVCMSQVQFNKMCSKNKDTCLDMKTVFENFVTSIEQISQGNCAAEIVTEYNNACTQIFDRHKQLTALDQGIGIAYYMSLFPSLYTRLSTSYQKLFTDLEKESLDVLIQRKSLLQNDIIILQEGFDMIKEGYQKALQEDHANKGVFLPVMKLKKNQLDQVRKAYHDTDNLIERKKAFHDLIKLSGKGGVLDPLRFFDKTKILSNLSKQEKEEVNGCIRALHDNIDAILQRTSRAEQEDIDAYFKIPKVQAEQLYNSTTQCFDALYRTIGLDNHPNKVGLIIKSFHDARSLYPDYAEGLFDIQGYRYYTEKIFKPAAFQCSLNQYKMIQDANIKLIALYAQKFGQK